MARKALGKGLSALIPDKGAMAPRVSELPVASIKANIYQPRKTFHQESIKELAASIKENGVIQPIIVQKSGAGYELIAGERRYRACKLNGMKTVPAIIRSVQKRELLELAIVENIQREDLNPIEEARAFKLYMEEFNLTQDGVAKKMGRSRPAIANSLRLLKLPKTIQEDIESGSLTMGHARALLACGSEVAMMEMRKQILDYGLNVREVEAAAGSKKAKKKKNVMAAADSSVRAVEDTLRKALSTKVKVSKNRKGGGQIVIEYYSEEDLERILENF